MIVMIMKWTWTCILKMFPLLITLQVYIKLDIFILCQISLFTSYCIESKDSGLEVLRKNWLNNLLLKNWKLCLTQKVLKKRQEGRLENQKWILMWSEKESVALESFKLYHSCMGFSCLNCGDQRNKKVNCLDCNELFCGNCDEQKHTSNPFHERVFFSKTRPGKQLLPTEFIDHDGKIFVKSVGLVLRSTKCDKCQTLMSQNTSSEIYAVVTPKGLFIYLFYVKNVVNSYNIFSDRDVQPE